MCEVSVKMIVRKLSLREKRFSMRQLSQQKQTLSTDKQARVATTKRKVNAFANSSTRRRGFQWDFFFSPQSRTRRKSESRHRETDATMTQKIRDALEASRQKKKTQRSITMMNVRILMLTEFRKINQIFFEILNVFRHQVSFFWIFLLTLICRFENWLVCVDRDRIRQWPKSDFFEKVREWTFTQLSTWVFFKKEGCSSRFCFFRLSFCLFSPRICYSRNSRWPCVARESSWHSLFDWLRSQFRYVRWNR